MTVRLLAPTLGPPLPAPTVSGRLAVMMSGGVDSSVSALLLHQAGLDVVGVTMSLPSPPGGVNSCCGDQAPFVCLKIGIPHVFVDCGPAFEQLVIEPFRKGYARGLTPSPCVDCNTFLKFGVVWDELERAMGATALATGHYARVVDHQGRKMLARASDLSRDQSYFLYGVPAHRLPFLTLPVGGLEKAQVRRIAERAGLHVARRPDSMELCFAGQRNYRSALGGGGSLPGPIVHVSGQKLGEHRGIHNFTVGQRRGIGVGGGERLYVLAVRADDGAVIVGPKDRLYARRVRAEKTNVLAQWALSVGSRLAGKVRSVGEPAPCRVTTLTGQELEVEFEKPVYAPACGQHLVLYDSEGSVVVGGVISGFD